MSEDEGRMAALSDNDESGLEDLMDDHTSVKDEDGLAEPLNTDGMSNRIWLVKIPKFVAEQWSKLNEEGVELGRIKIYQSNSTIAGQKRKAPDITLHIPSTEWSQDIPKNYKLQLTHMDPKNEYVFTENRRGRVEGIVGQVYHEANVCPIIDDDYKKIMQKRTMQAEQSTRSVQVLDEKQGRSRFYVGSKDTRDQGFSLLKKRVVLDKRERLPRDELLNMLFDCFEKYEHWTFKGLLDHTNQPQNWLKELVNEICILNKRGPYAGTYELRTEFKKKASSSFENPADE